MAKKKYLLVLSVLALLAAAFMGLRRSSAPIFLDANTNRYRVISARYIGGTNVTLAREESLAALKRRLCDVVGVFVGGSRTKWTPSDSVQRHAFCFLCDGQFPTNGEVGQLLRTTDAECIDDAGRVFRFMGVGSIARNDQRFWVVWSIPGIHETGVAPITNFSPKQFRLLRKSDGRELIHIDVPH
jgi:hypothetical protein